MTHFKPVLFIAVLFIFCSCHNTDKSAGIKEVISTEKSFEKMVADSGMAVAFSHYADENAVMLRKNDSIIHCKAGIHNFYKKYSKDSIELKWTVEFADISNDGTLAYTWGNSTFKILRKSGLTDQFHGKFHTVWKKQNDGSWKFVWD